MCAFARDPLSAPSQLNWRFGAGSPGRHDDMSRNPGSHGSFGGGERVVGWRARVVRCVHVWSDAGTRSRPAAAEVVPVGGEGTETYGKGVFQVTEGPTTSARPWSCNAAVTISAAEAVP